MSVKGVALVTNVVAGTTLFTDITKRFLRGYMKFIHCADIHADSRLGTHFNTEQAKKRREEIVDSFAKMVEYAKLNNVRAVLISGDLFDSKDDVQKNIKKRFKYIISQNPQIDFLYLRGNHDEECDFALNADLENLKTFTRTQWTKYSYENVDIYGREFGSEKIPVSAYNEFNVDVNKINIVMLHGMVVDYKVKDDAPEISLKNLQNKNLDYIALGHIHDYKKEKLDRRCNWCYSGCLAGRGFDECGQKGFVVLEIEDGNVQSEFVPLVQRTIHDIHVTLSGTMESDEILNLIKQKTADISIDDIVQIVLEGEISEDTEIDVDLYLQETRNSFYYVRFINKTEHVIDFKSYENEVSLKGEFIRLVNSQSDLSAEEKSKIIMTGIKALARRFN